MDDFSRWRSRAWCPFRLAVLAAWVGLTLALAAYGQVSPEEHKKHHPGQDKAGQTPEKMGGGMEGMGGVMEGMGKAPPKELYPSLMSLPDLPPEKREEGPAAGPRADALGDGADGRRAGPAVPGDGAGGLRRHAGGDGAGSTRDLSNVSAAPVFLVSRPSPDSVGNRAWRPLVWRI